jgi:nucleoside phosphorylase
LRVSLVGFEKEGSATSRNGFRLGVSLSALVLGTATFFGCGSSRNGGSAGPALSTAAPSSATPTATTPASTTPAATVPAATTPATPPSTLPVLVVCGLQREQDIAAGPGVVTVVSASDPPHLRTLMAGLQGSAYRAVVSFGIAGGLNPAFPSGQVMIGQTIIGQTLTGQNGPWTSDPTLASTLQTLLTGGGINVATGVIVGADTLGVNTAAGKVALRASSGADEIDNESQVAAAWALANGLPFVALRCVSDPQSHDLPPAALVPLLPNGSVNLGAILGSVFANPGQIGQLLQAYTDSEAAFTSLQNCRNIVNLGNLP